MAMKSGFFNFVPMGEVEGGGQPATEARRTVTERGGAGPLPTLALAVGAAGDLRNLLEQLPPGYHGALLASDAEAFLEQLVRAYEQALEEQWAAESRS